MQRITSPKLKPDHTRGAIAAIVGACLALSLGDALIKLTGLTFPIWQIYVMRALFAVPMVLALMWWRGDLARWLPVSVGWTVVRSLLLATMWVAYYVALPYVPLSVAAAGYYTLPLFITLFAGERVGKQRWIAIGLGFAGVLVMLRPNADGVNGFALLAILAAMLYAFAMLLTRTKCRGEAPLVLSLALNLTFAVVGVAASVVLWLLPPGAAWAAFFPPLLGHWAAIDGAAWLLFTSLALIIVTGSTAAAFAYQNGQASVVSVFDYSYLVFAVLWGFLIFAEVPDGLTATGMVMIAIAGILATRR